ncbi:TPA: hypothetical protein DCF80_04135 [Candidatus Saccharibacteria bacterium]|nr:hypothetical protein [Candidatus Saccharibacteria bacterium]HRK41366.1 hypothetical protein [Candidatus Saccharibacteria bacterium]
MDTPKPTPEHYQIPATQTEALDQAMADKAAFAEEVRAAGAESTTPHIIDVDQIPGMEQDVLVHQRTEMGSLAMNPDRRVAISSENVTPQMMRNAIGSPYKMDGAGRIVPREDDPET